MMKKKHSFISFQSYIYLHNKMSHVIKKNPPPFFSSSECSSFLFHPFITLLSFLLLPALLQTCLSLLLFSLVFFIVLFNFPTFFCFLFPFHFWLLHLSLIFLLFHLFLYLLLLLPPPLSPPSFLLLSASSISPYFFFYFTFLPP